MKPSRMTLMLALSVLLVAGCSQNSGDLTRNQAPVGPPTTLNDSPPLDELQYETVSGTLTPGSGGLMGMYSTTWPRNCWFGILVPPDALDEGYGPVEFTIQFPTWSSYQLHPEIAGTIPMRFEPSGLPFLADLTVFATWMPWEPLVPGEYEATEIGGTDSSAVEVQYLAGINRYRLTFQTGHFSDWELGPRRPGPAPDPKH